MNHHEKEEGLYTVETPDERIVMQNLALMKKEMMHLLMNESIGGNAGTTTIDGQEYVCAGANGYANMETGEILYFENYQNIPPDIRDNNQHFTFKVAVVGKNLSMVNKNNNRPKIVEFIEKNNFSEVGQMNIQTAIDEFNMDN
jgi:hypothetical protein